MCSRLAALGAALAAVMAACVAPAAAQGGRLWQPEGPSAIGVRDAREAALYQAILGGMVQMAEDINLNRTRPVPATGGVGIAAAPKPPPVRDITRNEMVTAIANVMASSLIQTVEGLARASLGDPTPYRYPDGSGRTALYRLPTNRLKPKGTCIFIHGCHHDSYSWFYKSRKCSRCTGLPEEVSHTKQCLARGYAVLALQSKDRSNKRCFASSGPNNDQESAKQVIVKWTREFKLSKQPKFMFGISAGAAFAVKFPGISNKAPKFPLEGIISEVNMPSLASWGLVDSRNRSKVPIPPIVFYEMKKDRRTSVDIKAAMEVLRKNRVPTAVVEAPPRPVTSTFLYGRSIYMTKQQSKQVSDWLFKNGVIRADGTVRFDVRVNDKRWVNQLDKYFSWIKRSDPYYNLVSDQSQIWQALNLAWSWHEIVSDFVRPTLAWLEDGRRAPGLYTQARMNKLVKDMDIQGNLRCLNEKREGCPPART